MSHPVSIADQVQIETLMEHVHWVTKHTKEAGTEGERQSLHHFVRRLEGYGYRVETILHDAYISLPGPARLRVGDAEFETITHSFSRPSPEGGLTAEVVFAGKGTEADFAGKDMRNKIVLSHGLAAPEIADRCTRAGAVGQIQISTNAQLYEMCISPVWGNPASSTQDRLPRTVVVTVSQGDGERLVGLLSSGKPVMATIHAEVDTGWRKTPLLVAEMEAPAAAGTDQFVLVSAHHDTWHFGVMDNGTANASATEIARLAALRRAEWKRGLRLCFWSGHSQGRYSGSAWYADTRWGEIDRCCVAHVNLDSTGGIGATEVHTTASMSLLRHLAVEAIARYAGQTYTGKRRGRSGDDSFSGIGVPSIFGPVSEQHPDQTNGRRNLGWWWHTRHDLIDKVSPEFLARDTQVVGHAVWRLLTDAALPYDFAAQIADLHRQLAGIAGLQADADFAPLWSAAERLADVVSRPAVPGALDTANAALLRASRALVPIDYTFGDRHAHDVAMPVPAWPALEPLRQLAAAVPGTEAASFARVDAVRARNRVIQALDDALEALSPPRGETGR